MSTNLPGFLRKSTISASSAFSSSAPATSAKVTFFFSSLPSFVRALPKRAALPAPPSALLYMKYHIRPIIIKTIIYGRSIIHQDESSSAILSSFFIMPLERCSFNSSPISIRKSARICGSVRSKLIISPSRSLILSIPPSMTYSSTSCASNARTTSA